MLGIAKYLNARSRPAASLANSMRGSMLRLIRGGKHRSVAGLDRIIEF
jgi:hypothetical protein